MKTFEDFLAVAAHGVAAYEEAFGNPGAREPEFDKPEHLNLTLAEYCMVGGGNEGVGLAGERIDHDASGGQSGEGWGVDTDCEPYGTGAVVVDVVHPMADLDRGFIRT